MATITESESLAPIQRVQVEMERQPGNRVKIRVENYDEQLEWYTAGSLSLPMHQIPLLEQALERLRAQELAEDKIIPFPACRKPS